VQATSNDAKMGKKARKEASSGKRRISGAGIFDDDASKTIDYISNVVICSRMMNAREEEDFRFVMFFCKVLALRLVMGEEYMERRYQKARHNAG
jgi:hypothetical protein